MKTIRCFPLTLTLSLAERGQPLDTFLKSVSRVSEFRHRFAEVFQRGTKTRRDYARTLGAFPPLLGGEGRGEGKRTIQMPASFLSASKSASSSPAFFT